jgi:two-component system chemotaxis sensor kinase CheA
MPSLLAQFPADDGFLDEIASALPALEANLNHLEQKPDDAQALEQAYRHVYQIKETASMQDAMGLSQVAHAMQDVLGDALDEVLSLDKDALGLLRRSLERVRLIVERLKAGTRDIEQIVAEDEADHISFRKRRKSSGF